MEVRLDAHTGQTHARSAAGKSIFVTGGSGYIGLELVRTAVARGYDVLALARSRKSATVLGGLGATPVTGDLMDRKGEWTSAAVASRAVIHLAQPQTFGGRVTNSRAVRYRDLRLRMDRNLLDTLLEGSAHTIVYVAGTSYYGDSGKEIADENAARHPKGWGPYLAPSIEGLNGYVAQGLPIVTAFPGWVYGPASWFAEYVLDPLCAGKPITALRGPSHTISPIHVEDCARALVHLIEAGQAGHRYFLVDDEPVHGERLARLAAQALNVPFRVRTVPRVVCRLLLGRVITESLEYENTLSNAKLRATGFEPLFPTSHDGVPDVVAIWLRDRKRRFSLRAANASGTMGLRG